MNIFKEITGHGENIVLIHGGATSHLDMTPIAEELASRYRVINIDLPATGKSPWDPNIHTIHDIADRVVAEMPEHAIYIGWSFGGLVAQSIAIQHPQRIKHLICINSSPKFLAADNWPGFPASGFEATLGPALTEEKNSRDILQSFYEATFSNIKPEPILYKKIQKILEYPPTITNELLLRRLTIADLTDLRASLKTIACPIDFIVGDNDSVIPQAGFKKIIDLNPKIKIHEIKNSGHASFWTHPKEFNEILNRILK